MSWMVVLPGSRALTLLNTISKTQYPGDRYPKKRSMREMSVLRLCWFSCLLTKLFKEFIRKTVFSSLVSGRMIFWKRSFYEGFEKMSEVTSAVSFCSRSWLRVY